MAFRNEITYHKKWESPSNLDAQRRALEFLGPRSRCLCDVPAMWAKDVSMLLKSLQVFVGIKYDLSSFHGYNYESNFFKLLFVAPFKGKISVKSLKHHYSYAFKVIKRNIIGYTYNTLFRPQMQISQVKEKFGHFTFYYYAEPEVEQLVENLVKLTNRNIEMKYKENV